MTTPGLIQEKTLTLSEAEFYQEHGWIATGTVLDDQILDEAWDGLRNHWTGHRDHVLPFVGKRFGDWMPGDGESTRNNEYLSLQNLQVRKLAWSPIIGRIAASAAMSPEIRLFDDQLVYKPGGQTGAVVGWHVDGDYWGTCASRQMLTAWIPLHECSEEQGPLVVLDGSHKWSHLLDRSELSFHKADMEGLARKVNQLGFEFKPVVMNLKKGQFSLHHCRTVHGSYPNRSGRPRIALAVHMQDASNHYKRAFRPDGRPVELFNDVICRRGKNGDPDYKDNNVFPVLWNAEPLSKTGGRQNL